MTVSDLANITLEGHGALVDHLGERATVSIGPPYQVWHLRDVVAERWPAAVGIISRSAVARGDDLLADDAEVADGDTLALVPPVSGG